MPAPPDLVAALGAIAGEKHVTSGDAIATEDTRDEALTVDAVRPLAVVRPATTGEVTSILRLASEHRIPVTARGSGTGLAGGCVPCPDGILVAFDRMDRIVEIDTENHVAVVEPGVTLAMLDEALAPLGLVYPVYPGETSGSLGGNASTNAGGMRAIRHGVTRHHVLGLEAVLASGEVLRTGGKFVKSSVGYDLTQLLVGSEGTLALITRVTLKVQPRMRHAATVLAPFATFGEVARAVPRIVASGVAPAILEYIDAVSMISMTANVGLDLGIPEEVRAKVNAYLVVVLESMHAERVDADIEAVGTLLAELGALDVYVLPRTSAAQLIDAREKAFWVAKASGANDIVDVVVPRAQMPTYLARVLDLAAARNSIVAGCGHVGDGNVHLSVFQPDDAVRKVLLTEIMRAGIELGGAISGEHGIGTEKLPYFEELEDPVRLALMARIKAVFDPDGILNPGHVLSVTGPPPT